jgi:excisionase family DNA binding protein
MKSIETFTPKELAAELKVPYRTVLQAIKNKQLRVLEFSAKYRRIRSEDAAKWIQSITK